MYQPQEVIIYRSAAEYNFWNSGIAFPLIVACVLCLCVAVIMGKLLPPLWKHSGSVVIVATALTFCLTMVVML
jgi:hypothetical protein